jgi:hypothetical protein
MVEHVLNGCPETVNEQLIGEEVFHRPRGYSPAEDNIVRVTVSNLRARLEDYYHDGQGKKEHWILDVPKGKYVPHLRYRDHAAAPLPAPQPVPIRPELTTLEALPSPTPRRSRLPWILLAAVLLLNLAGAIAYYRRPVPPPLHDGGFLQQFFGDRNIPVSLIVADANLQAYRVVHQQTVPLQAYIDRSYLKPGDLSTSESRMWTFLSLRTETTVASARLAGRFQGALYPLPVAIRHPQELSLRDLQKDSLILMGGPWINPWGQLFESHLTFQIVPRDQNRAASEIRNTSPQPGEPDRFVPHTQDGFRVSYARIALVPNLTGTGHVILLGSNTPESMEAAGEFLVKPYGVADLLNNFHRDKVTDLPPLEVMLEVRGVSATPDSVRVIAHRTISPQKN